MEKESRVVWRNAQQQRDEEDDERCSSVPDQVSKNGRRTDANSKGWKRGRNLRTEEEQALGV